MQYIVNLMIGIMDFFQGLTGSWGLAIIGLTATVRVAVLPFTIMQVRSARAMAVVTPEIQRLQKKYKDDPERLNLEMMDLYKQHKVSPFSSCLGLALQLPVLLAMVQALGKHPPLQEAVFLGLKLGSPPNPWWPIVLVSSATTYLSMRFSPSMNAGQQQGSSQNVMMLVMLALFGYFVTRYAAAVSVYIITTNVIGVLERFIMPRGPAKPLEGESVK